MSFEFLSRRLNIPKERITVTVFIGDAIARGYMETADYLRAKGLKKSRYIYTGEKIIGGGQLMRQNHEVFLKMGFKNA